MSFLSAILGGSGGGNSVFSELVESPLATTAIVAAAIGCFMLTLQRWRQRASDAADVPLPAGISLQRQAAPVKGEPNAFCSSLLAAGERTVETVQPEVTTLYQVSKSL